MSEEQTTVGRVNSVIGVPTFMVKSGKITKTSKTEAEARKVYDKIVKKYEDTDEPCKVEMLYRENPRDKWMSIDKFEVKE